MRKIKQNTGLTLIELMVTLTVLGIMVAIGVPQYQGMMETNRMAGSINSLASDLKLARTEAAKRSQVVTICASADGQNCSGNNNWETGWIVFSDQNRLGDFNPGIDFIVSSNSGLSNGLTLTGSGFPNLTFIQYAPAGQLRGAIPRGTFLLCRTGIADVNIRNTRARGININNTGRVSAARDNSGNFIREDFNGDDFACPL